MDEAILAMLEQYHCKNREQYVNALKEIVQEIALLGLWRSKFFEHALFYGGSALRILYKLDRFSEDLDFSLLEANADFDLLPYLKFVSDELRAFGFEVEMATKKKKMSTAIESAFIKLNTVIHMLKAKIPPDIVEHIQSSELLKIKIELDTDPPGFFETRVLHLLQPIPFQVKTMTMESLFAGKLHAILARAWKDRVKGRDYYDWVWYVGRDTPYSLTHLEARLVQTDDWDKSRPLTDSDVKKLLREKINSVDWQKAKRDVEPFLKRREAIDVWSLQFFNDLIEKTRQFIQYIQ